MKNLVLLISSIIVLIVMSLNLHCSLLNLSATKMVSDINESNTILSEIVKNNNESDDSYIEKLNVIENRLNQSSTMFITEEYKSYRLITIDYMKKYILSKDNNDGYLENIYKYNKKAEDELSKILQRKFTKVTL